MMMVGCGASMRATSSATEMGCVRERQTAGSDSRTEKMNSTQDNVATLRGTNGSRDTRSLLADCQEIVGLPEGTLERGP